MATQPQTPDMTFDAQPVAADSMAAPVAVATAPQARPQVQAPVSQPSGMVFDTTPRTGNEAETTTATAVPDTSFMHNVGEGVGTAAAQSLANVAKLGSHIPGVEYVSDTVGDILGLPKLAGVNPYDVVAHSTAQNAAQATKTTGGKVGTVAEGVAEFVLGEEALKGLTAGERLMKIAQVTKNLEKYPAMAEAAEQAMKLKSLQAAGRIARVSAVSAGQSALHAEPGQEAQAAKTGAKYGAAGGVLGEAIGAAAGKLFPRTQVAAKAAAADQLEKEANNLRAVTESFTSSAAKSASEVTGADSNAATFQDAANEIKKHFNPVYDELRKSSGGVLTPGTTRYGANGFDDAVNQINRAKKVIYSSAPSSTEALKTAETELAEGQSKLQSLFGSDTKYAEAQAGWRKASTLEDFHDVVDKAFTEPAGVRKLAGYSTYDASGDVIQQGKTPSGEIDPKKFVARANKAIDSIPNLKDALGDDAFQNLEDVRRQMAIAMDSKAYAKSIEYLTRQILQKQGAPSAVSKTLGGPSTGVTVGTAAHFLFGASNPVSAGIGLTAATAHYLYTHPDIAVPILRAASRTAPVLVQAYKSAVAPGITHVYSPDKGLQDVSDVYANEPSFQMPQQSSVWDTGIPKLADAITAHEGARPERNNPGNLKFAGQSGAVDDNGYAKFNTPEDGRAALEMQLAKYRREHPTWSHEQFVRTYSPDASHGGDNPEGTEAAYVRALQNYTK